MGANPPVTPPFLLGASPLANLNSVQPPLAGLTPPTNVRRGLLLIESLVFSTESDR